MVRLLRTGLVLLLCCLIGAGPAEIVDQTVLALSRVPHHERAHTRFLAMWPGVKGSKERQPVYRFWLNSLTFRRRFVDVPLTEEGLLQIDLKAFGWKAEVWDRIAKADPYFAVSVIDGKGVINRGWVNPRSYLALTKETGSFLPVLRADWFLARTSLERGGVGFKAGFYSDILGLPATEKELFELLGSREKLGADFLGRGGAVLTSEVAIHNRELQLFPSLRGKDQAYLWRSLDTAASGGKKSVLENFVGAVEPDGKEHVFSLPNGLQGYYLANGQGQQAAEVPTNIAQDRAAVGDVTVLVPRRCVTCHPKGVRHFEDVVKRIALNPKVRLDAFVKDKGDRTRELIEDYYLSDLGRTITSHQQAFDESCKACCGLPAEEVSAAYGGEFDRYFWGRVGLEQARSETGFGDELEVYLVRSNSITAKALLAGETISREEWEGIFHLVMKAAVYPWEEGDDKVQAVPAAAVRTDPDRPVYRP